MPDNVNIFVIEDGTIENFNRETHKRGKSWVATVVKDKSQPGGLRRSFLERAPAGRVFITSAVQAGTWLEFAGDYYTTSGSKRSDRQYFRVLDREGDQLHAVPCTVDDIGRPAETPALDPQDALRAERDRLVARIAQIDALLEGGK